MRESFERFDRTLLAAMRWSIIVLMVSLVCIVFAQIIARYLLSISLGWSEEAARLAFICTIFLGAAVLVRRREHLTVTVFTDLTPPRVQRISEVIATAVGLWCSYYMLHGAWRTLMREWDQLTPALRIPMGFIYAIILIAVTLMVLWLVLNLLESIRRVISGDVEEPLAAENPPVTGVEPSPNRTSTGRNGS